MAFSSLLARAAKSEKSYGKMIKAIISVSEDFDNDFCENNLEGVRCSALSRRMLSKARNRNSLKLEMYADFQRGLFR